MKKTAKTWFEKALTLAHHDRAIDRAEKIKDPASSFLALLDARDGVIDSRRQMKFPWGADHATPAVTTAVATMAVIGPDVYSKLSCSFGAVATIAGTAVACAASGLVTGVIAVGVADMRSQSAPRTPAQRFWGELTLQNERIEKSCAQLSEAHARKIVDSPLMPRIAEHRGFNAEIYESLALGYRAQTGAYLDDALRKNAATAAKTAPVPRVG